MGKVSLNLWLTKGTRGKAVTTNRPEGDQRNNGRAKLATQLKINGSSLKGRSWGRPDPCQKGIATFRKGACAVQGHEHAAAPGRRCLQSRLGRTGANRLLTGGIPEGIRARRNRQEKKYPNTLRDGKGRAPGSLRREPENHEGSSSVKKRQLRR